MITLGIVFFIFILGFVLFYSPEERCDPYSDNVCTECRINNSYRGCKRKS